MSGLSTLIALPILVHSSIGTQQDSLLLQVYPRPTGTNGMEEYLQAAAVLNDGVASIYFGAAVKSPSTIEADLQMRAQLGQSLRMTDYLDTCKMAVQKYGAAIDLVEAGNQKPCLLPEQEIMPARFQGYRLMRDLLQLHVAKAYVEASEGHAANCSQVLFDAMALARRVMPANSASYRNARMGLDDVFVCWAEMLSSLSLKNAQSLQKWAEALIQAPSPAAELIARGASGQVELIEKGVKKPGDVADLFHSFLPAASGEIGAHLTQVQVAATKSEMEKFVTEQFQSEIRDLQQPETEWYELANNWSAKREPQSADSRSLQDMSDEVSRSLLVNYRWSVVGELVMRAKLRILDLDARITEFRWKKHRLPTQLQDLGADAPIFDPLSKEEFTYKVTGPTTYKLFSKGKPDLGPIDLLAHPSLGIPKGDTP